MCTSILNYLDHVVYPLWIDQKEKGRRFKLGSGFQGIVEHTFLSFFALYYTMKYIMYLKLHQKYVGPSKHLSDESLTISYSCCLDTSEVAVLLIIDHK